MGDILKIKVDRLVEAMSHRRAVSRHLFDGIQAARAALQAVAMHFSHLSGRFLREGSWPSAQDTQMIMDSNAHASGLAFSMARMVLGDLFSEEVYSSVTGDNAILSNVHYRRLMSAFKSWPVEPIAEEGS